MRPTKRTVPVINLTSRAPAFRNGTPGHAFGRVSIVEMIDPENMCWVK